jgi:hypothetical protein
MREWLTVELLLGTLLVTTFTGVGLLALWVATSSRSWFVRAATALGLLSPWLLIPAQGAFLICWFTVWLVAVAVAIYRRRAFAKRTRSATEAPRVPWQFSIKSALIVCAFASVTLAVIASVADDTWIWPIVALSAPASAYVTLLAASVVSGPTKLRTRIAGATLFMAAICAAAVYCKLNLRTPLPFVGSTLLDAFLIRNENQTPLLLAIIGATFVVTVLTLLILAPGLSYAQSMNKLSTAAHIRGPWLPVGYF